MTNGKRRLIVFGLCTALTLLMTYPLVFHLGSRVRDPGDPLLNSWILSWNIHKITRLDFHRYFDANIFYPQRRTLAYSEHLFPQSLAAMPVWLVSKNPVLAHNLVFLLAFITSALGLYALARYLVKNNFAAFVAGLIYAFSPFMFAHLSQIQVATAAGIPLALLYLHKFFESNRRRDILLFAFFYVFQFLANGYYGMYLSLFSGLLIVFWTISGKKYGNRRFWINLGLFLLIAFVCVGPFLHQYVLVRKEMGFAREPGLAASIRSYLATAPINRLYGRITAPFLRPEGELFPGLAALALAVFGFLGILRLRRTGNVSQKTETSMSPTVRIIRRMILACIVGVGVLCVLITVTGGWEVSFGQGLKFKAHGLTNPVLILCVLAAARWFLGKKYQPRRSNSLEEQGVLWAYSGIFFLALLFSLGSQGPYMFLYKYVPGFNGLRVPSRFHIFVMLSLAIFAAFGIKKLLSSGGRLKKFLVKVLTILVILVEYASMPLPLQKVPVKKQIPEVYQWLAAKKDEPVIVELPLPSAEKGVGSTECLRVYFSAYHWKKMVNGYSGYFPQIYDELCRRWQDLPVAQNIADLQTLGVDLIIVHTADLNRKEIQKFLDELEQLQINVPTVGIFGTDYVLAVPPESSRPAAGSSWRSQAKPMAKAGWSVQTNINQKTAGQAIDGSLETRWESGPQKSGLYFILDLKRPARVRGIALKFGRSPMDYPRGYTAEISLDGVHWQVVARQAKTILPIQSFLNPRDLSLDIDLGGSEARFIRLTETGEDPTFYWSIYEIEVFE